MNLRQRCTLTLSRIAVDIFIVVIITIIFTFLVALGNDISLDYEAAFHTHQV